MKANWLAGTVVAGLGLVLGLSPLLSAQEEQPGVQGSAVMQEDLNRVEQTGPDYEMEGAVTGAAVAEEPVTGDAVQEGAVSGAAVGPRGLPQAGRPGGAAERAGIGVQRPLQSGQQKGAVMGMQQPLPAVVDDGPVIVAVAQPGPKPAAPGRNYIWVQPYRLPSGLWVQGYWRPRTMAGFVWVNGTWDRTNGYYIAGYWRPARPKTGHVWVPGYWLNGRWYPGLWRAAARNGFVWVPGHWSRDGQWVQAHWRPAGPAPAGQVWVPGHYNPRGQWVPGRWRMTARSGAEWVPAHYNRRGEWIQGHWRQTAPAPQAPPRNRGRRGPGR